MTAAEAADAEIVVLAVPGRELSEAVPAAEVSHRREVMVVDTTNPPGPPDSRVTDLQRRPSSEVVAGLVAGGPAGEGFPHPVACGPRRRSVHSLPDAG